MTWNLAYHHLLDYVFKNKLAEFNTTWLSAFGGHHKNGKLQIAAMDDFSNLITREVEVLKICRTANIITKDTNRILEEKLGKRNSAAHPSGMVFNQIQVEAYVDDLVHNVMLKLV